jgi:hypothetical protein
MNSDPFDGAGDFSPLSLTEQRAQESARLRWMLAQSLNALKAIHHDLDDVGDVPKSPNLGTVKRAKLVTHYQSLHGVAQGLIDTTVTVWKMADDSLRKLAEPVIDMEKRPARRLPNCTVLLERTSKRRIA